LSGAVLDSVDPLWREHSYDRRWRQQHGEYVAFIAEHALPGADHVLGDVPVKQREVNINKLHRSEGHILTDVRCLNDTVVVTDPKSSPVDIAQAVGRVLRTAPSEGKTKGRIVIPVAISAEDWESGILTDDERDTAMSGPSPYRAIFDIIDALASDDRKS